METDECVFRKVAGQHSKIHLTFRLRIIFQNFNHFWNSYMPFLHPHVLSVMKEEIEI